MKMTNIGMERGTDPKYVYVDYLRHYLRRFFINFEISHVKCTSILTQKDMDQ